MSWTRCQKSVEFKIYIHNKPRYAQHARLTSISSILHARLARSSSISSMLVMWLSLLALLDPRASRACQSRDLPCSLAKRFEQYACYDELAYPQYWFTTCLKLVTLSPPFMTFVSKVWKMSPIKSNNRTSSQRKQFLFSNFEILSLNMRPCKSCSFVNKQCLLSDAFEKCFACVASKKSCDLAISSFIMRRVHKERLRVQNEVREAKAKLQRLERQLKRLKDEEENLILREWDIVNCLEEKELQNISHFIIFFDVVSKQFQFPNLDWSFFVIDFLAIDLNKSREVLVDNS